jgi:hypothetical protein
LSERPTQQPRTRCRLSCTVKTERNRIRALVLDVSEGGLCIVTPRRLRNRARIEVVIDDPRHGAVEVEAVVWHDRPFRQPSSGRKGFATGLMLSKAGPDFQALASPETARQKPKEDAPAALHNGASKSRKDSLDLDAEGPCVYRVRLRAVGSPRLRTLTLAAASEAAVREAVLSDLPGEWEVLEVEANPLD